MLTKRQNLLEVINGGNPDRFVNQFEPFAMIYENPITGKPVGPGETKKDVWGVTFDWPEGAPGEMPVHGEQTLIKDIENWRDYIEAPNVHYPAEVWAPFVAEAESIDRDEYFATVFIAPGIFEQTHHMMEITNCLVSFVTNPEEMHELIDFLTDWEIAMAEQIVLYLKPEVIFHHDDWGSQISTFISPEMFEEFILPAYKRLYGFYKENGVDLIVHHSDSYGATLVPYMVDMGIDIWQGVMTSNNLSNLIAEYGGKISFMGGIDSASVDKPDWTSDIVYAEARRACEEYGKLYYIPCATQGLDFSTHPGVYECLTEKIDELSKESF